MQLDTECFGGPWTERALEFYSQSFVYLADGKPVGCILCSDCTQTIQFEDLVYIGSVAVDPKHRRKGIARSLILHAINVLKPKAMSLDVRLSNTGAQALYESIGFKLDCIVEGGYRDPTEDLLHYILDLTASSSSSSSSICSSSSSSSS